MMFCPAHGEVLPCPQCLSNLQAKPGPPWCCEKGEAANVKVCPDCAEASAGYQQAMSTAGFGGPDEMTYQRHQSEDATLKPLAAETDAPPLHKEAPDVWCPCEPHPSPGGSTALPQPKAERREG